MASRSRGWRPQSAPFAVAPGAPSARSDPASSAALPTDRRDPTPQQHGLKGYLMMRLRGERRGPIARRVPSLAVAVITALLGVSSARAAVPDRPALLNDVARVYSLGVGEVRCPSSAEWEGDPQSASFTWGYTNLRHDYSVLPPMICAGATKVAHDVTPAWQRAAGVWMLVHETFHLRHWRLRRNEAKVGCQTIVYFTDAASRLGASDAQAWELYPYALAFYELEISLYPWRRDASCIVPPWIPPSGT